jgi:hypothetical protein
MRLEEISSLTMKSIGAYEGEEGELCFRCPTSIPIHELRDGLSRGGRRVMVAAR